MARPMATGVQVYGEQGTEWVTKSPPQAHKLHHTVTKEPAAEQTADQRLRTAAFEGKLNAVRRIVAEVGIKAVDKPDKRGWTALMYACRGGHREVAKLLVNEGGANVNAVNSGGWTALLFAAGLPKGDEALVRLLIEKGADTSAETKAGLSCAGAAGYKRSWAMCDQVGPSCSPLLALSQPHHRQTVEERTHDDFNNGARYKLKPVLPVLLSPVYLCIARLVLELHSLVQAKAVLLLGPAILAGWELAAVRLLLVLCNVSTRERGDWRQHNLF